MADYLEQSLSKLEEFEGVIPWMYRDTVGRVTVGVGSMLPDAVAARKLPFQRIGRAASEAEVAAEYGRVDALPMGRPALFYRIDGGLELEREAINRLLRSVVEEIDTALRARLPTWDTMPPGPRLALIDMAYNLGTAGLLDGYPKMLRAIEAGQWTQAAAASFRHGPGAARNQWTHDMLAAGVVRAVAGAAEAGENRLKRLGYGLIGLVATWLGY